ncbi:hypothetical protein [Pseudomonas sp. CF161]|uniref:hypothetical protein n=1 Tax=Pseudomonas sp. CF161 TaxID=911241 RepID=UPI0003553F96|nr:hypothetical protein [Pseudomonas sp. CF161]EPL15420.1 hypothetical protein CF161_03683 [Pseudomonas sp. CF161]
MMSERYRLSYAASVLFARQDERVVGRNFSLHNAGDLGKPVCGYVNFLAHIVLKRPQTPEGESNAFMTAGYQIEVEGETTHG